MKKSILSFAIILSLYSISFGQVVPDYLFSADIEQKIKKHLDEKKNLWNLQNHAIQYSFIGNYEASLETHKLFLDQNKNRTNAIDGPKADLRSFKTFKPVNAVKAIAKEAEKYNVVITNEYHYQPQNRVFTTSLLKALYKKGFRYFAAEDLAINDKVYKKKEDSELNSRKYAVKKTGYYISEPQYGNMVRTALKIGYKMVPYDYFGSEIKDPLKRFEARENGQARNIANVLKKDPNAKVLVHSGVGHLNEKLTEGVAGLMGAMLKKNHKIDPLTIDQITYLPERRSPYSDAISIKRPSVFINNKGNFFSPSDEIMLTDMKVFFPKTNYEFGRPNWLFYPKGRKFYFPKLEKTKLKYPLIVMAYVKGENIDEAIPFDVIELKTADEKKALVLEKGSYTQIIKSRSGKTEKSSVCVK